MVSTEFPIQLELFHTEYMGVFWDPRAYHKIIPGCARCGIAGDHNCTKMAGQKSPHGPLPMINHSLGWPYTDPNIPYDC